MKLKGIKVKDISPENFLKMKQYFILSQVNDWNTSTITQQASLLCLNAEKDFPLEEIKEIAIVKSRAGDLTIQRLENNVWFTLKVLIPNRSYIAADVDGRYKPELDHIFPTKLENRPSDYSVNYVWNLQPVMGTINSDKTNTHPKTFFENESFAKYFEEYDFVPPLDDLLWNDWEKFIKERKNKMISFLKNQYSLEVVDYPVETAIK
jgi:hypothetical protein